MLKRAGQAGGAFLHRVLVAVLALALLGGAGAASLAWRLSRGPLPLGWAARRLEAAVNTGPTRLHIGAVSLAWSGWQQGEDQPLVLVLDDVHAGPDASPVFAVPHAVLSVSFTRLLIGEVRPRLILAENVRLHLLRGPDGSVAADLGSLTEQGDAGHLPQADSDAGKPVSAWLNELARPAHGDRHGGPPLAQLRRVRLSGDIRVTDRQLGTDWALHDALVNLTRARQGGVHGDASARLALNGAAIDLRAEAGLAANGATSIAVQTDPANPAAIAGDLPRLAPLRAFDAPVGLNAMLALDRDLHWRRVQLSANAAQGIVHVNQDVVHLQNAALALDATPERLALTDAAVTVLANAHPTTLHAAGTAQHRPDGWQVSVQAGFDHVAFPDLAALWPASTGGGARPWLVENVSAGTAHDGNFHAQLAGPDPAHLRVTDAGGQLQGDDLQVWWLRPVPPLAHGHATLTLRSADLLEIAVDHAQQGNLQVHDGLMRIDGLSQRDQTATIDAGIGGQLADAIALLRHKRLKLLSAHPVKLDDPAGTLDADLSIRLPLEKHVTIEQIAIHGQAALDGVHLTRPALERNLDDGAFDLDVTNAGLHVDGNALLAGVPAQLNIDLDFRDGPPAQVVQHFTVAAQATDQQMRKAEFSPGSLLRGRAGIDADYSAHRDGTAEAALHADLTESTLSLAELGWTKRPGTVATAQGIVRLLHNQVTGIDGLRVAAPGLMVTGHTAYRDGRAAVIGFDRIEVGGTRATATLRLPDRHGAPWQADLHGPVLDLSDRLTHGSGEAQSDQQQTPWVLDARFDHVRLSEGRVLNDMTLHADHDGNLLQRAHLQTAAPERLQVAITPDAAGRKLHGSADDAGALLHAFNILPGLHGGRITLDARFDDSNAAHDLHGRAEIDDFHMNTPAAVKMAQALSVYGLLEAARNPGINISKLVAPFVLRGSDVNLNDARAYNSALGITAKGQIDLDDAVANLSGTIVPAYFFNSLLGKVPLLGRLFSPERGGGVFSASYTVRGKLTNPVVSVNPLTALTPGVLRSLGTGASK